MVKNFKTSQECWEQTNEGLFINSDKSYSHISLSYDNMLFIDKPRVDPDFDFAKMFNYRINKWKSLVNNYVDKEGLKEIKKLVAGRETKKSRIYQHTLKFSNNYKNGKDCLISLTFSKRAFEDVPILIFHTRALEATKRMLLDLLLVQRMGEYVYGKYKFRIGIYCPMVYLDGDTFTMYENHNHILNLVNTSKGVKGVNKFQQKVLKSLHHFQTTPIDQISYKVNKRCARQLQFDKYHGHPIGSGDKTLYAKHLKIEL